MNNTTYIILAIVVFILALHLAPVLLLVTLKLLSDTPKPALKELAALGLPADTLTQAQACIERAKAVERKTLIYDCTAPVVMFYALLFTKRSANHLPPMFSKWDNNISLNGDGEALIRDGQWLTAGHDLGWEELAAAKQAGERVYRYSDVDYAGDAYYCEGHHPRSWYARYIWLGWRNRASQLSVDLGADVTARPVCISGDTSIGRAKPGHFLLQSGELYHYKAFKHLGPLALIRSYGVKLEYALNRPDGQYGRVPHIAIGRSFKGAK